MGASPALAQITPDATLGSESSVVTPDALINGAPADLIEGGALRGANVFHSFQDFNVAETQRVYFANPTGVDNIVSRVTGGNVSNILGTLGVDGGANLFLLNPNGVVFGANAQLDVSGAFAVSTADRYSFLDGTEFSAANPGQAPLVTVGITPGVQFNGTPQGNITNHADLTVGAGQTLALHGDTVISSGDLTAEGGTVQVLGNQVALTDQATIDVAGTTGGGDVFIGGDFQGQGDLPTAQQTYVGSDVTINADALDSGDGGTVIVWADDTTQFYGTISATGGATGGDGGFVEVSGAQTLGFWGTVDTTAPLGEFGTLLLDPDTITVVAGATPDPPNAADGLWASGEDPGAQTIGAEAIVALLDTTALTLQATTSITVDAAIDASGNAGANDLTLDAPTLTLNQNISTEGGQIYDGNVVVGGAAIALTSDSGAIAFNGTINGATAGGQSLAVDGTSVTFGDGTGPDIIGGGNRLASLTVTGATTINSTNILTTGNQQYNDGVILGSTTDLNSDGGAIFFNSTIDAATAGTQGLTVNGANGVTFGDGTGADAIGGTRLASLTVTGATTINSNTINTTGAQTYNSDVILGETTALDSSAGTIAFDGTIDAATAGTQGLTVNGTNGVIFGDGIGADIVGGTRLAALTVTGATTINSTQINTDGNQTYNGSVLLNQDGSFTSDTGTIRFNDTVDSAVGQNRTLTLDAGNNVVLAGAVGGTVGGTVGFVDATAGGNVQVNAAITTTGDLTLNSAGAISAGNNLLTVGGNASFTTANNNADITANGLAVTGTVAANTTGNNADVTFGTLANPVSPIVLTTSDINGGFTVVSSGTIAQAVGSSLTVAGNASFTTTLANAGDVFLRNSNANFVLGPSDVGGNLTLVGNNSTLTQAGGGNGLRVAGNLNLIGIDDFSGLSDGVFGLSAVDNAGNVIISQPGTVNVTTAVQGLLGSTNVNGDLTVQATDQGFVGNFSGVTAITLNQAGNDFGGQVSVNTPIPTLGNLAPEIVQSGAISVVGDSIFNANTGNITLTDSNSFAGFVSLQGDTASLVATTAVDLNTVDLTGNLAVTSGGDITDTAGGTITVAGTVSLAANPFFPFGALGNIILDNANAHQLGDLTLRGVNITVVENDAINIASIPINLFAPVGNLTLTANGDITQTGAINTGAAGTTTLTANGGDILLTNGANRLGTLVLTANNATLIDTTPVTFGLSTLTGNLAATSGGAINQVDALTVAGTTTLTGTAGQPITLTDAGNSFGGLITLSPDGIGAVNLVDSSNNTQVAGFTSGSTVALTNNSNGGTLTLGGAISAGLNITLTADTINLNGNTVSANASFGTVRLQPFQIDQDMTVNAATANTVSGRFIVLGRDDGTGTVTIANNVTFDGITTIQGGAITANGNIRTSGDNLTLIARGLNGDIVTTGQQIRTGTGGAGDSGNVTLISENGNVIFGDINTTSSGAGDNGGNVLIQGNSVSSTGAVIDPFTGFGGTGGRTGSITLQATGFGGDVDLTNVTLFGDNYTAGGGGIVSVLSDLGSVNLTNSNILSTNGGSGVGGDVILTAAQDVTLTDATVRTDGTSTGFAGNIYITGVNVNLDDSQVSAQTVNNAPAGGVFTTFLGQQGLLVQGANINITSTGLGVLTLSNNSLITARGLALNTPGGNILIRGFSQFTANPISPGGVEPGNDIITSAEGPLGGVIDTDFAFTQPDFTVSQLLALDDAVFNGLRANGLNDIASSGIVLVLDFSLLDDTQEFELDFLNAADLVGNSCAPASATSSFTVGGRGGTPVNPLSPLSPLSGEDNWIFLEDAAASVYGTETTTVATDTLVESTGQCYFQWQQALS